MLSLTIFLSNISKQINLFQFYRENKINLLLNHLAVVYMFFVSFAPHGYAVSFIFTLMYILIFIRGYYVKYLKISLSHPLTISFLLLMLVHYLWLFGTDDTDFAHETLKYAHYLLYPFFFFLFLDQRFYTRLLSTFLAGVMMSELLSYFIQFNIIPREFIMDNIQVPWKETGHFLQIIFYSSMNNEPTPFLEHSWYSILLATASSILFYKSFHSKALSLKIINLVFFITLSINLFFIGGRIGYLLYVLLLITNIFIMTRNKISIKSILIALSLPFILMLSMYQLSDLFHKRVNLTLAGLHTINNTTHNVDGSFSERFLIAKAGLKTISDNFLLGIGTGDQLWTLRSIDENINNPIQHLRDVHNQHLDMFLQFGLLGFLFYLNVYYRTAKFKTGNQEKDALKTLILISMFSTAFFGSFWYFLPVLFTTLIIITTADKNILTSGIEKSNIKTVLGYIFMIFLSYTVEQLQ